MGGVSTIFCESGSIVEEDEVILDIEMMKMFNQVASPIRGKVSIFVAPGSQVGQGQLIAIVDDAV